MNVSPLSLQLPDSAATEGLGAALARTLGVIDQGAFAQGAFDQGALVHLRGELGSGKTTCARSLLHALGVTATVRSPTYTLVDTYDVAKLTLVHVDLYRVQSSSEVEELGLRDLVGPKCLMLIEWPEKGGAAVPRPDLIIQLKYQGKARAALIGSGSSAGESWLSMLAIDSSLAAYVTNLA